MPQAPTFRVECQTTPRGVVMRLNGEASADQCAALHTALHQVGEGSPALVVLDLSGLTFISSLGLGHLLEFRKELSGRGAALRLAGANAEIAEVFRTTRLVEVFPMYRTADQAIGSA